MDENGGMFTMRTREYEGLEKTIMMAPETYADSLNTVEELREAKRELVSMIEEYESSPDDEAWVYKPSPQTVYITNLEYLAEICRKLADLEKKRGFKFDS